MIVIICMMTACSSEKMREAPAENQARAVGDTEKVYVTSAEVLPGVTADNEVSIVVKGNLPNPAYRIERYDVNVDGAEIEITPLAHHDKDKVVIQMLVAFEDTITVKLKEIGKHSLKLNGRGDTIRTEATIVK